MSKSKLPDQRTAPNTDIVLHHVEHTEKRFLAIAFLSAKMITIGMILAALLLLDVGLVRRIMAIEFPRELVRPDNVAAPAGKTLPPPAR